METICGTTKRWGNSLAVIIPSETVHELGLKPEEHVDLLLVTEQRAKQLLGKLTFKKTTQQLKDEARKELW